jgi:2-polyprenyl-6-methoxyphenol hydroxylase-like FAD-dependent oxidoreductase
MGGLLAARALAEFYEQVTVVERDALPPVCEPRKGVPQGRHAHGLLARGREILDELFPGLSEELVSQSALYGDVVADVMWFNHGVYLSNAPSTLTGLLISRPMLEEGVRRRLRQLPNIRLHEASDVRELVFDRGSGRVTGLRLQPYDGAPAARILETDLVVDASGRGSRNLSWLQSMGYAGPRDERVEINLAYMTRLYRRLPEHLPGKHAVILAPCRPDWRLGVIMAQEENRWIVTLGGYLGDHAPGDDAGFLEFARSLQAPEIFDVIKDAEPLSPFTPYQYSANLRRHYEELTRFPTGFLVFGDALCSFNPVYGQGMTVACTEALALRDCLASGADRLAERFFKAASRVIDVPWQIAVGSDLQHPKVHGERTTQVRFTNWYLERFFYAAQRDAVLATRFLEIANLTKPPAALLEPRVALRVCKGNLGLRRSVMRSAV